MNHHLIRTTEGLTRDSVAIAVEKGKIALAMMESGFLAAVHFTARSLLPADEVLG